MDISSLIELGAYLTCLVRWHAYRPLVENYLKDGLYFTKVFFNYMKLICGLFFKNLNK